MKIRHILLLLAAISAIAFMEPLITFLGGLALLLGVGGLIFRDLPPASQNAVERRLLGWLRRARTTDSPLVINESNPATRKLTVERTEPGVLTQTLRRGRAKTGGRSVPPDKTSEEPPERHPPPKA